MKILVFLLLLVSASVFAKPNIDYKLIPKNANVFGYVSTKSIMSNKYFKKFLKSKENRKAMKKMKKMGIDIKKLGSLFFYADTNSVLKDKNASKSKFQYADYALVLHGLNLEKLVEMQMKNKPKAEVKEYKGIKVYHDINIKENNKGEFEAVAFMKTSTVLGSLKGVKNVINSYKSKTFTDKVSVINSLHKKLGNPEVFAVNLVNDAQRALLAKQKANPMLGMFGATALIKTIKLMAISLKINNKFLKFTIAIKGNEADVKTFVTTLSMQYKNFKPMIMQKTSAFSAQFGQDATKEIKSILDSVKIVSVGDMALISLEINIKNASKILNQLSSKMEKPNRNQYRMKNHK